MADYNINSYQGGVLDIPFTNKANTTVKFVPNYFDFYWTNEVFGETIGQCYIQYLSKDFINGYAISSYGTNSNSKSDVEGYDTYLHIYDSYSDNTSFPGITVSPYQKILNMINSEDGFMFSLLSINSFSNGYLLTLDIANSSVIKYFDDTDVTILTRSDISVIPSNAIFLKVTKVMPVYMIKRT